MISAGSHQFRTLWTRDFCFSVPGLLSIGMDELVGRQLDLILSFRRSSDGLLPRGIDTYPPTLRVFLNTVCRFFPENLRDLSMEGQLRAEYLGEHKTLAADSNILTVIASCQYGEKNPDWFKQRENLLLEVFHFSTNTMKDGLLFQPAFSDWQDSARREGHGLYLQVLYLIATQKLAQLGANPLSEKMLSSFKEKIVNTFFDKESGLFSQTPVRKGLQFPLEAQLWLIEHNFFSDLITREQLFKNLKNSLLWKESKIPAIPIWPRYPEHEISWTTKTVGLAGYHDSLWWSWLMGESARICVLMKDLLSADSFFKEISALAERQGEVSEVYSGGSTESLSPFKTFLYSSEQPFTWGAAKILEALAEREKLS